MTLHNAFGPVLTPEDLAADVPCCYGSIDGPERCTCWAPVYELAQQPPRTEIRPLTRSAMCSDCAYRRNSPERLAEELPDSGIFYCHEGMRRPIAWAHPDGRTRTADPADYQPAIANGVAYRADGLPAARCAGWARSYAA